MVQNRLLKWLITFPLSTVADTKKVTSSDKFFQVYFFILFYVTASSSTILSSQLPKLMQVFVPSLHSFMMLLFFYSFFFHLIIPQFHTQLPITHTLLLQTIEIISCCLQLLPIFGNLIVINDINVISVCVILYLLVYVCSSVISSLDKHFSKKQQDYLNLSN